MVDAPDDFSEFLDVEHGVVGRPPMELLVLTGDGPEKAASLLTEIEDALTRPPFSSLGLDISASVLDRRAFVARYSDRELFEFEQARRASYTNSFVLHPEKPLPRLICTVALDRVVRGDRQSPLELARKEAEKRVLVSELALADDPADLAARLDLPQAEVRRLLLEHGIDEAQQTFAISLSSR